MTPAALWTGRLPGLRSLPRKRTLWAVGALLIIGAAGVLGAFGPNGAYLGVLASLAALWTVFRHRWPTELPVRLRSLEAPQGPDERAVMVEIREGRLLLGWDVGILWFEKGGVGFAGRTVSFVIPRSTMEPTPAPTALQAALRAPQMQAKVFDTTVGIVPLAPELRAEMTLARIEALPDATTSETILPPTTMHPELLQRGLVVRRRVPILIAFVFFGQAIVFFPALLHTLPSGPLGLLFALVNLLTVILLVIFGGTLLPSSIRERLPK